MKYVYRFYYDEMNIECCGEHMYWHLKDFKRNP